MEPSSIRPSSTWNVSDLKGEINARDFCASIQLTQPEKGVEGVTAFEKLDSNCHFLGLHNLTDGNPLTDGHHTLDDAYVRGNDLIASFPQSEERSTSSQVYWRFVDSIEDAFAIDVLISKQTSFLQSDPSVSVRTTLSDGTIYQIQGESALPLQDSDLQCITEIPFVIYRPRATDACSYVEMVHPSDIVASELKSGPNSFEINHHLFRHELEKGVIRRGRVRGAFVRRADDVAAAQHLYDQFVKSPPPLTT